MKDKVRFVDKTERCNRRCGSCEYWKEASNNSDCHFCNNDNSNEYGKAKHYWNCCKSFTWAENIIDKNDLYCSHCIINPINSDALCFYYSRVDRKDKLAWGHFPRCIDKNCPIKHSELLNGESPVLMKDEEERMK